MEIRDIKFKLLKTIFIVISLGLLSKPWVVVCDEYEREWKGAMNYAEEAIETWGAFSWINSINVSENDEDLDVEAIEDAIECLSDGEFTALEMNEILDVAEFLVSSITAYTDDEASDQSGVIVFSWFFKITLWCVIILGVVQIYSIWFREKANFENGFYFSQIALMVISATLCGIAYSEFEVWIVRPTIWTLLAVFFSMPSDDVFGILEKIGTQNIASSVTEEFKPQMSNVKVHKAVDTPSSDDSSNKVVIVAKEWSCKGCNTENSMSARYCVKCGKKKSEIVICEICGYKKWDDEPCKNCVRVVARKGSICSKCGCKLDEESVFCQYCGTKVNGKL